MVSFSNYQAVVDALKDAKHPLFVLLKSVDPDALGSAMALALAIQSEGVKPTLFCAAEIPLSLHFLLDSSVQVLNSDAALDITKYDSVIIGDTGQLDRTGIAPILEKYRDEGGSIINIDHHFAHEPFGSVNLVDASAASTTELVYDILKLGDWTISIQIATAILAGIIADTDNFSNAGTTIRSLEVAAHCYAKGAEARRVIKELYQKKPVNALKLWGAILTRLTRNEKWGIVSTVILREDYKEYDISDEATEGLANFLNNVAGMRAALILKQLPMKEVRGSLRTTRDDVDVSRLAQVFGGGGHRKAAGFTVPGTIIQTENGWKIE